MIGTKMSEPKFKIGDLVITSDALEKLAKLNLQADMYLAKHIVGDWGEMPEEDKKLNDLSLSSKDCGDLWSIFVLPDNTRLWIVTTFFDSYDMSNTTIMLPEDY